MPMWTNTKTFISVKKIKVGILAHAFAKIVRI